MQYDILESDSAAHLSQKVNARIKEGWEPLDGLVVIRRAQDVWLYAQAMVKRAKKLN